MAKRKKKKVNEFKQALLSNTNFINEADVAEENQNESNKNTDIEIDKSILLKFKILAKYKQKSQQELINEALSHYLRLKRLDLDKAMENFEIG